MHIILRKLNVCGINLFSIEWRKVIFLFSIQEKITEVCRISNDGLRVCLYSVDYQEAKSSPLPMPPQGVDSIYSYETLPLRHHKKYLYAARYVNIVKAKTPKLTIYTSKSKCLFMENSPNPNCEVHFYDGIKVRIYFKFHYFYVYYFILLFHYI